MVYTCFRSFLHISSLFTVLPIPTCVFYLSYILTSTYVQVRAEIAAEAARAPAEGGGGEKKGKGKKLSRKQKKRKAAQKKKKGGMVEL